MHFSIPACSSFVLIVSIIQRSFFFFFLSPTVENKDRFVRRENRLTLSIGIDFIGRESSRYVL